VSSVIFSLINKDSFSLILHMCLDQVNNLSRWILGWIYARKIVFWYG